ncbi:hypothetical protein B0O80DRAFT_428169 [Mortierella sp. GBAus27b]|nr:hypothetical protein B0O80DRAFT_428169 [Mortierella sp. GBAus27b]
MVEYRFPVSTLPQKETLRRQQRSSPFRGNSPHRSLHVSPDPSWFGVCWTLIKRILVEGLSLIPELVLPCTILTTYSPTIGENASHNNTVSYTLVNRILVQESAHPQRLTNYHRRYGGFHSTSCRSMVYFVRYLLSLDILSSLKHFASTLSLAVTSTLKGVEAVLSKGHPINPFATTP